MNNVYVSSIDEIVQLLLHVGGKRTVVIEGDMGIGKSTLLKILKKLLPDHVACYLDGTTKDLGDLFIPDLDRQAGCVSFLPNEQFGVHLGKPVILMLDELGKANPSVKNALLVVILERMIGNQPLPEGSIVFGTTNLGAEGVGDTLPPHARNRIITVRMRKPSSEEWINNYAINNDVHPSVMGFVKEFPQVMQSFTDVTNPEDNPYIYHPKRQANAFCTPRSLECASDILHQREHLSDDTLTGALIGTIGERSALDMMAFVKLADKLPTLESIKNDPSNAIVPDSASAVCMVVYRALSTIDRDWVDAWITYMKRLSAEAQGLFAMGVKPSSYGKRSLVMQNKQFTQWAMDNNYMFASDKE
jgi:energy-coupling factor transporter ATP-binding protein EcfA2